ncbi:CBU_0592 family membrane protein [Sulfitobacter sp. S190]|uniref:CBU_0592 family membrane protein n=1 Tax=Sulfitobacter sp. S190 TaxID=2867022 RepID=UPI0021A578A1|nr:hypothetical protein [Sulfitobacter sp. S190]UWR21653.1 hypothetical protein K3756_13285 [Sulfitobacter sp. S190]
MIFTFDFTTIALALGLLGFCVYVMTYAMLTLQIISGNSVIYFTLNLTASTLVLIGLTVNFNLAAMLIQLFWITMSIIGISMRLFRRPALA